MSNSRFEIKLLHDKLSSLNIDLQYDKTIPEESLKIIQDKYNDLINTTEKVLLEGR